MTKFEIGDVVRLKTDSPKRLKLIVRSIDSDRLECTSECERRRVISHGDDFELVERPDPQADMKQAIREVLLSDEFMTAFAAAFFSATVPRSTLEHPIPGVSRPMRNEAQLLKMVELDMDNLITLCREHHFRIGHDPSGDWEPTKDEIEYAMDRCGVPASDPLRVGDAVELQSNNVCRGTKGVLTNWCPIKKAFWFESLDPSRKAIRGWMKEQWDDEETGTCRLVKIDHPNDSPKPDSSSESWSPKVGDKVWVLCEVIDTGNDSVRVKGGMGTTWWTHAEQCRPVEPSFIKDCLTTEPNSPKILDSSSKPTPKQSKTQPPSDYRMLGSAKDEPRQASDLYWSLSAKNWIPIKLKQVEYANRDDWAACRKIEVTSPPPTRYREPTLADLTSGPIACEYRDDKDEQWKSGLLVYVLDQVYPFLCVNKERIIAVQWRQCQIEVAE